MSLKLALLLLIATVLPNYSIRLALLDTAGRDQTPYQHFLQLAHQAGYATNYYGIDQLADTPTLTLDHELVLLLCDPAFLAAPTNHPQCQQILKIYQQRLQLQTQSPQFMTGLILPTGNYRLTPTLKQLLKQLKLKRRARQQIRHWLRANNMHKPLAYHTSLKIPTAQLTVTNQQLPLSPAEQQSSLHQRYQTNYANFTLLPAAATTSQWDPTLQVHLPLTLCYPAAPQTKNNAINSVILPDWLVTALGTQENFQLVPQDARLRAEFAQLVFSTLQQLHTYQQALAISALSQPSDQADCTVTPIVTPVNPLLANLLNPDLSIATEQRPQTTLALANSVLPPFTTNQLTPLQSTLPPQPPKTKIAWLELTVFAPPRAHATATELLAQKAQQEQLLNYIFTAKLDCLWLSLSPQMYLSPRARYAPQKTEFYQTVTNFYQQLKAASEQHQVPLPALYLGFEIANNLYHPHLPVPCAVDLFGHTYSDLPAPLDSDFWQQELILPLQTLCQAVPHIPWAGVVLDLEMYLRQQTNQFSDLMGFEPTTKQRYLAELPTGNPTTTPSLMHYYHWLTDNAQKLGTQLRAQCTALVPHCQIMLYLPNLNTNWFYAGLFHGLSNAQRPLYLLTFNTDPTAIKAWLTKQQIYGQHATVMMLSKFTTPADGARLAEITQGHDGIWFNRWSRLVEPFRTQHWTTLESTNLSELDKLQLAHQISRV